MSKRRKPKRKCPLHHVRLVATGTPWGTKFVCPEPDCTVRCWQGSTSTPCDQETATERKRTHEAFDPLWQPGPLRRFGHRNQAYRWLAEALGIAKRRCHIGMMTADECRRVRELIQELRAIAV